MLLPLSQPGLLRRNEPGSEGIKLAHWPPRSCWVDEPDARDERRDMRACGLRLFQRRPAPAACAASVQDMRGVEAPDAIAPQASSAFVAAMEDVLAVYKRPRDGGCPLVCLDETSKQLLAVTRAPIPMKPGQPARHDYEYERNGTANLFMMFAPLEGWRRIKVTDRRTAIDYAHAVRGSIGSSLPECQEDHSGAGQAAFRG